MARYDPVDDYIPNQTNAPKPYTPIITSAKAPNWLSLDERPTKPPRGGKRRRGGGGNLMDTGPDDANPAQQFVEQLEEANNPLESGLSQGVQNASAPPAPSGSPVAGPSGPSGALSAPGGVPNVGFRPLEAPTFAEAAAPVAAPATPPAPQAPPRPRRARSSNLLDTGPDDDGGQFYHDIQRNSSGDLYGANTWGDPNADRTRDPFRTEIGGIQIPSIGGAFLQGVSGISNYNLDNIQDRSQIQPGDPGYDPRYSYGELGPQRFGTSPGLVPGTTVYSGPDQIRGIAGVNQGIQGSVAGARRANAAIAAAQQPDFVAEVQNPLTREVSQVTGPVDPYTSISGNTYVGQVAAQKEASDEAARAQGVFGSAVTDSAGRAVTSTNNKGETRIVGQESTRLEPESDDNDSGGGGK